jgi:uncharacterized membrane-anchored protein YjiN (DUF445 family)
VNKVERPLEHSGELDPAVRLRRMQWLATGLLAAMATVFVLTSIWRARFPLLDLAWAFSEAALIGGLADWFAVTALFRHPLGLPIPHTAIVPNRKDQIGRALARFVADHFLVRSVLEAELGRLNPARSLGRWLKVQANAANVARDASRSLSFVLSDSDSGPLRGAIASSLGELSRSVPTRPLLTALIDVLASGRHAQQLIDSLVAFGREQLDRNKSLIRERIHERSPWWLPRFVDEEIFDQLVTEIERILREVGEDGDHAARAAFADRLGRLKQSLIDDPEFTARNDALRDEFLHHPAVVSFGLDLSLRASAYLSTALDDPGSALRQGMERELLAVGARLADDGAVAAQLNDWLMEIVVYVIETYRAPISSIISTTIGEWDAAETSRRIELQIGRDLQFIRINGTLVGGLVGLVLYLSWTATIS